MVSASHPHDQASLDASKSESAGAPARDVALDFVKGVLVIVMVVYHAMNVFTTAVPEHYAYVRFVSGSFIVLSGYVAAKFFSSPFASDWRTTSQKLSYRGLKLVLLFTALNLAIALTGVGNPAKAPHSFSDPAALYNIYVVGDLKAASFQILLPIGYLLMLTPAFLWLRRFAAFILIGCLFIALLLTFVDSASTNLESLLLGILGVTGFLTLDARKVSVSFSSIEWIAGGLFLTIVLMRLFSYYLLPYALGTIAILKLLHDLGLKPEIRGAALRSVLLLGRYSLFSYIAQIVWLQLLARRLGRPRYDLGVEFALICIATAVFLVALCASLKVLRERSFHIDRAYRLVFA